MRCSPRQRDRSASLASIVVMGLKPASALHYAFCTSWQAIRTNMSMRCALLVLCVADEI